MKRPTWLDTVKSVMLVDVSVNLTSTSGTASPCWSLTWPDTVPDEDCAHAETLQSASSTAKRTNRLEYARPALDWDRRPEIPRIPLADPKNDKQHPLNSVI